MDTTTPQHTCKCGEELAYCEDHKIVCCPDCDFNAHRDCM